MAFLYLLEIANFIVLYLSFRNESTQPFSEIGFRSFDKVPESLRRYIRRNR